MGLETLTFENFERSLAEVIVASHKARYEEGPLRASHLRRAEALPSLLVTYRAIFKISART